ncbi:MAG: response regulator [Planctomycetes bacterium]|nr:response regulator [Planctomycetota bacterium]
MVTSAKRLHGLVIDDDPGIRSAVGNFLSSCGHKASWAECRAEALSIVRLEIVHFCIVDVHVREDNGMAIIDNLRRETQRMPVIFMSGGLTAEILGSAQQRGAYGCIAKPLDLGELRASLALLIGTESLG